MSLGIKPEGAFRTEVCVLRLSFLENIYPIIGIVANSFVSLTETHPTEHLIKYDRAVSFMIPIRIYIMAE
jgi:hypothetical protein